MQQLQIHLQLLYQWSLQMCVQSTVTANCYFCVIAHVALKASGPVAGWGNCCSNVYSLSTITPTSHYYFSPWLFIHALTVMSSIYAYRKTMWGLVWPCFSKWRLAWPLNMASSTPIDTVWRQLHIPYLGLASCLSLWLTTGDKMLLSSNLCCCVQESQSDHGEMEVDQLRQENASLKRTLDRITHQDAVSADHLLQVTNNIIRDPSKLNKDKNFLQLLERKKQNITFFMHIDVFLPLPVWHVTWPMCHLHLFTENPLSRNGKREEFSTVDGQR